MPELRRGVRRGRARVAHKPSDLPPPSRRTRATVAREAAEAVVRPRTRLAVRKLKEEEKQEPEPEPEQEDRVIVISEKDSDSEGKKGKEIVEEDKKAVMADDSGGLSANKAAGQEEEGSTAPFPEKVRVVSRYNDAFGGVILCIVILFQLGTWGGVAADEMCLLFFTVL